MVLVFKTSVRCKKDVEFLIPALNKEFPNSSWNFDLEDCDNVFRIVNPNSSPQKIAKIFNGHGFMCTKLD